MNTGAVTNYETNVLPCEISYRKGNPQIDSIISRLVQTDGLFLDPVYNAKSFLTMIKFFIIHPEFKNIVYINTGGSPNLF